MYLISWLKIRKKFPQVYQLLRGLNWFVTENDDVVFSPRSEADFVAVLINEGCKVSMHRDIITDSLQGLLSDVEPLLDYLESHLKLKKSLDQLKEKGETRRDSASELMEFDILNGCVNTTDEAPLDEREQAYVKAFLVRSLELALDVEDYELASQIRDQAKFWGVDI